MNKHLIAAAAAAALLGTGATVAVAQGTPPGPPSVSGMPAPGSVRDAPTYVAMAGASDLYEIQSSQLVLQSTQNAAVRKFAQMMIADHTNTTQQVMSAAQSSGMSPPPPQLMPPQAQMLQDLQAANGGARDRLYATQQLTAHQLALTLHRSYASHGDDHALMQVANTAVPIIQHHLAEVTRLQRSAP